MWELVRASLHRPSSHSASFTLHCLLPPLLNPSFSSLPPFPLVPPRSSPIKQFPLLLWLGLSSSLSLSSPFPSSIPPRRLRQAPTSVTRARGLGGSCPLIQVLNAAAASPAARVEVAGCLLRSEKLVSSPRTVSLPPRHLPSSTTPLGTEPGGQQSRRRVLSNGGRQHLAAGWNLICFLFGFSKR